MATNIPIFNYTSNNANTQIFNDFISESVLPNIPKNTTLFIDNATIHKSLKLKKIIESYDCKLLFNISYSPEFNPIELFQNVLKRQYYQQFNIQF